MEQARQQPELPPFLPSQQPFVRAPSPPKAATEEQLTEMQLLLQTQYTPSGVAISTGKVPKSALKKRTAGGTPVQKKAAVTFREFVVVAYTWSPDEYDRTSIQITPITKQDMMDLYAYRAELEATTNVLYRLRDQAINEQLRLKRQQQQQKIAMAMASSAARVALHAAAASYGWGSTYPALPPAATSPYPDYVPYYQPHYPLPGAGHAMPFAEGPRQAWASPVPFY
ncbi:hypothetical protein HDV00_006807 [Rhizophlyctis rosea]|nr:hypothetical protein HDV00_006807 [Rhizophlyctis rosea]